MNTRPVPKSGVAVPVVGLGTWQTFDVGDSAEERAPLAEVLRRFFAGGGRVIDVSRRRGAASPPAASASCLSSITPMRTRTIKQLHRAERDDIADLQTRRPLPGRSIEHLDPFLFLNHHGPQVYPPRNHGLPFGPHPHRGFETATFILAGDLVHRDTGGGESMISAGGVQWMTAGRGLVHAELSSERFEREGGPLEILQLWVNLPARLKLTAPRYIGLQQPDIPTLTLDGGKVTVSLVAGTFAERSGPVAPLTDVHMMTVQLVSGGRLRAPVGAGRTVFLYVVRGAVAVAGTEAPAFHLVELHDGDEVELSALEDSFLLFGHATPYREPIVAHGPFVMNTREEIRQAMRDYSAGKFGTIPA